MQDDINVAVEEQSVLLLRAALQRRHACPGEHALHEAVRQAHVPALRLLLQSRAEPNARCLGLERGCEFPLQLAATCAGFLRAQERCQAVDLLLRAGARPSPRRSDAEANTPLHDAIRRGDFEVARLLLLHGADPNAANGHGERPLQLVLRQEGCFVPTAVLHSVAEALLHAGASPHSIQIESVANPDLQAMLARWSAWWRCRLLAWIHSRGRNTFLRQMMPELLLHVARYL